MHVLLVLSSIVLSTSARSRHLNAQEWDDINRLLEIADFRRSGLENYGSDDPLLRSHNDFDQFEEYAEDYVERTSDYDEDYEDQNQDQEDYSSQLPAHLQPLTRKLRYSEDADRYEAAIKAMDSTNKKYLEELQGGSNKPFKGPS